MPTHFKGTPEETLALNTFIKLHRAVQALDSRLAQRNTRDSLTPTQFGVLETLHHLGPLCQRQLADRLLTSDGNLTMVIDHLEKRGLVLRQRSTEDRRKVTVLLTESGQDMISDIFPHHARAITQDISQRLTPEEQETLGVLCKKIGLT